MKIKGRGLDGSERNICWTFFGAGPKRDMNSFKRIRCQSVYIIFQSFKGLPLSFVRFSEILRVEL